MDVSFYMNIYLDGIIPNTPPKHLAAEVNEDRAKWRKEYMKYRQEHPGQETLIPLSVAENDKDLEKLFSDKGFTGDLLDIIDNLDLIFEDIEHKYNLGHVDFENDIERDDSGRLYIQVSCNAEAEMIEKGEKSSWDYPGSDPVYDVCDFFIYDNTCKAEINQAVSKYFNDRGMNVSADISYEIDQESLDRAIIDAIQEEYENEER